MTADVPTVLPAAALDPAPTVAVIGAGIAGLTAAHELVDRGFTVTVYEPQSDERARWSPPDEVPPVKLGGLAASQYAPADREPIVPFEARMRRFPGRGASPVRPTCPVPGEHGFRFFPAYYLHMFDTLQRIPVYEREEEDHTACWRPTDRTVFDNVGRVVTQAVTTGPGTPTFVFPREIPGTLAEMATAVEQVFRLGFTPPDIMQFAGQLVRYLGTSTERRRHELEHVSAYEFFRGFSAGSPTITYSPAFEHQLLSMPKVLAAFDGVWGDARTNITTFLQLQFQLQDPDNKADGVLNGPTTEAWFDHWYRHLANAGVEFVNEAVATILPPVIDPNTPVHERPGVTIELADQTRLHPDYVVVAVDAVAAEAITADLRTAPSAGTVRRLDGFASSAPPVEGPRTPRRRRTGQRRNPFDMQQMGRAPWDRFQTLSGIQYFFDTEFQLVRGHVYYTGTEWGLSSINQHGLWQRRPSLARDGYVSVLSVDIGDWNTVAAPGSTPGAGKAARDCTPDEIAAEVWRQIGRALVDDGTEGAASTPPLPMPAWYTIDRHLHFDLDPDGNEGPPVRNEAPYLVPIVSDWDRRPGGHPWNPNASSATYVPRDDRWEHNVEHRHTWQARHGGYQVHHNSVVFAGTWTKTFTRMTSMEAANESARHAVNAILDHAIWTQTGGTDRREEAPLRFRVPFGFLDQRGNIGVRVPTPMGDYCFVFDIENREPLELRMPRIADGERHRRQRGVAGSGQGDNRVPPANRGRSR